MFQEKMITFQIFLYYFFFTSFFFGFFSFLIYRQNFIKSLIALEILYLSYMFLILFFSLFSTCLTTQIFILFLFAILSCETAIGLSLIVYLYRLSGFLWIDNFFIRRQKIIKFFY